jgi:hypothetical protein
VRFTNAKKSINYHEESASKHYASINIPIWVAMYEYYTPQ